jgi:hypothetical protein
MRGVPLTTCYVLGATCNLQPATWNALRAGGWTACAYAAFQYARQLHRRRAQRRTTPSPTSRSHGPRQPPAPVRSWPPGLVTSCVPGATGVMEIRSGHAAWSFLEDQERAPLRAASWKRPGSRTGNGWSSTADSGDLAAATPMAVARATTGARARLPAVAPAVGTPAALRTRRIRFPPSQLPQPRWGAGGTAGNFMVAAGY